MAVYILSGGHKTHKELYMKKKNLWFGILVITLVFTITVVGCDNDQTDDKGNGNGNGNGNENDSGNAFLGTTGPGGGKVFYYSAAGFTMTDNNQLCHYLEAAPDDMSAILNWASSDYLNTNITGTNRALGTGRKNTALILATDANAPAAKACKDYRGPNNLADWFLPSNGELSLLYTNRSYVGNMGTHNKYWSSSQGTSNTHAFYHVFSGNGNGLSDVTKNMAAANDIGVRAIRAY